LLLLLNIIWLFFFYNVERLSEPINITSMAYTFVPLIVVSTMLIPGVQRLPLWAVLSMPIPAFLVLKTLEGSHVWGSALPLTVTEICAISITTLLARWVSSAIREFENAVTHISVSQVGHVSESFSAAQGEMYREVQRARIFQRPLLLMALRVEEGSVQVALDRMVQEAQQAMMKQYVLSGVSRTLCDELDHYNVIAKRNDHFLVLLPETTLAKLPELTRRLRKAVSEQVGVTLQIGTAALPDDALTFESLVEKAVHEMEAEPHLNVTATEPGRYDTVLREKADGLGYHQPTEGLPL